MNAFFCIAMKKKSFNVIYYYVSWEVMAIDLYPKRAEVNFSYLGCVSHNEYRHIVNSCD